MENVIQSHPIYGKLHHVGVVVSDIEKSMAYLESMGAGPFRARDGSRCATVSFEGELHGKPAEWKTKITNGALGDVLLELLQPIEGDQALKESLDAFGEGLHHLGFIVEDIDAAIEAGVRGGLKVWTSSRQANKPGFAYFLPDGVVKIAVEIRTP